VRTSFHRLAIETTTRLRLENVVFVTIDASVVIGSLCNG
jgi:hypothetical protein